MTSLSYIQPELWQVSCLNFEIFVTMVTGVGVIQILFAQLNSPTLKTLCFVQEFGKFGKITIVSTGRSLNCHKSGCIVALVYNYRKSIFGRK